MKISNNIYFKTYGTKKLKKKILTSLKQVIKSENEIIKSLGKKYINNYSKKTISKLKRFSQVSLIGMGGSILGAKSIYSFLRLKIKKNFMFFDNLKNLNIKNFNRKKNLNLIISKSGNTLETISNTNILIKKNSNNIFITEKNDSYLMNLAKNFKSEIIHHNNFIGGRYSVLSEVGMLPAELMGLKVSKFRNLNNLIKNKNFMNSLIFNVSNTLDLLKNKKFNSIILNYDENSNELFYWYQQLIAESLGKKGKGIFPIVSTMPKDNHSLMQFYLDGNKKNFFTFFFVDDKKSQKINNETILPTHKHLRNKSIADILKAQYFATKNVFEKRKIPFRSFFIKKRDEQSLGELFTFFILETILLGKAMNVNPFDQPAVELIKSETKKMLLNS